jgi:hypothetical protein
MMAKKSSAKLAAGARVRVKPGTVAPEMPEVPIEGWSGTVAELTGPKANPRFIIEWDDVTVVRIPANYRQACEQQGLLYSMACLGGDDLDIME